LTARNRHGKEWESVAVVGLGYVGLGLAVAFGRRLRTVGFDLDEERVSELSRKIDRNGELEPSMLAVPNLAFEANAEAIRDADAIVVAVPTPIDESHQPDCSFLVSASTIVGKEIALRRGADSKPIVIYESTVYPGCTEELCIPILEDESGLRAGIDFFVAYSPERTNFGDQSHGLNNVVKVVAGQDEATTDAVADLYGMIVEAGIHRAPNIRTAEAAKVIENVQRDVNIALMNELAMIFHRLDLDTSAVLDAASTKWNFMRYEPGLVGGHCIPVDPYYLSYKAQEVGHDAELILSGRKINESIPEFITTEIKSILKRSGRSLAEVRVLVLGIAFKPNIRDARNTKAADLGRKLAEAGAQVRVHDPLVAPETIAGLGLDRVADPFSSGSRYEVLVLAVNHDVFLDRPVDDILELLDVSAEPDKLGMLVDVGGNLDLSEQQLASVDYWTL
jgi:UDP-N-acetyl-D-galactosamine dehydrogenase